MYAVVCYFNYRTNQSVEILKTFSSLSKAINSAKKYACDKYTIVMDHVIIKKMLLDNYIIEFTEGTGYEKYVYAVVKIPETSDDEEEKENIGDNDCSCDNVLADDTGALFLDHSENCRFENTGGIDTEIDTGNDTEIDTGIESEIDSEMESDDDMSDTYDEDYDTGYGFDCGYDERYDEREDYDTGYGFDCGYEDEGYECCDL